MSDLTTGRSILASSVAFAVVLAVFGFEIASYRADVERWARRDLRTQTELAAENLAEPLRTQDFRKLHELAAHLESRGILLTVHSGPHGILYRSAAASSSDVCESLRIGDYRVELGYSRATVFRPFDQALLGFSVALLLGVLGMFLVFLTLYRQRVRIRELARLEAFRRRFIADLSHEIKTPLTGILGAVDLMDASDELVKLVKAEALRLHALVQQILDLARLERVEQVLRVEPTDLTSLLHETVGRFAAQASAARTKLTCCVASEECLVLSDRALLEQALGNLVQNAIRYAGASEIRLGFMRDGASVRVFVEDDGVGIPAEHRARIFERFYRVDDARAGESGGAGLGLAIVRRIAQLLGGAAFCEPVKPHGVRFTLRLPASHS